MIVVPGEAGGDDEEGCQKKVPFEVATSSIPSRFPTRKRAMVMGVIIFGR